MKNLKVRTRYNILNFPALFSALAVEQQRPGGQNGVKIQNDVSLRFFPEMHALVKTKINHFHFVTLLH